MTAVPQPLRANLTNAEFAQLVAEAAALRAENQRLREALATLVDEYGPNMAAMRVDAPRRAMWRNAVAALKGAE